MPVGSPMDFSGPGGQGVTDRPRIKGELDSGARYGRGTLICRAEAQPAVTARITQLRARLAVASDEAQDRLSECTELSRLFHAPVTRTRRTGKATLALTTKRLMGI